MILRLLKQTLEDLFFRPSATDGAKRSCSITQTRYWLVHFQDHGRKSRLIRYEGNHIYCMVEASGIKIRYSNVGWVDNEMEAKKEHLSDPLASASKRQRRNRTQEKLFKILKTSKILNKTPVFANYQLLEPTQDFSHPSRN